MGTPPHPHHQNYKMIYNSIDKDSNQPSKLLVAALAMESDVGSKKRRQNVGGPHEDPQPPRQTTSPDGGNIMASISAVCATIKEKVSDGCEYTVNTKDAYLHESINNRYFGYPALLLAVLGAVYKFFFRGQEDTNKTGDEKEEPLNTGKRSQPNFPLIVMLAVVLGVAAGFAMRE